MLSEIGWYNFVCVFMKCLDWNVCEVVYGFWVIVFINWCGGCKQIGMFGQYVLGFKFVYV